MERSSLCVCFFFRALFYLAVNVLLVRKGPLCADLLYIVKLHVIVSCT